MARKILFIIKENLEYSDNIELKYIDMIFTNIQYYFILSSYKYIYMNLT